MPISIDDSQRPIKKWTKVSMITAFKPSRRGTAILRAANKDREHELLFLMDGVMI